MRTQQEIADRMEAIKDSDVLGFGRSVLVSFLDFDNARPFLKDDVTAEEWQEAQRDNPIEAIMDYMEFAWEKANRERSISAYRSLAKIEQWAWLAEDEALAELVDSESYYDYGKAQLADVCRYLKVEDWEKWAIPYYMHTE